MGSALGPCSRFAQGTGLLVGSDGGRARLGKGTGGVGAGGAGAGCEFAGWGGVSLTRCGFVVPQQVPIVVLREIV